MATDKPAQVASSIYDDIDLHDWQDEANAKDTNSPIHTQVIDNTLSPTSAGPSSSSSRPSYLSCMHSTESLKSSISAKSMRSSMIDEIKHEVMVNFLFQRQCSSLWIGDGCGELEGVMLRKTKGVYLSCPPQLIETVFGQACLALNVQVV
jgi:hypothetical protein